MFTEYCYKNEINRLYNNDFRLSKRREYFLEEKLCHDDKS